MNEVLISTILNINRRLDRLERANARFEDVLNTIGRAVEELEERMDELEQTVVEIEQMVADVQRKTANSVILLP